MRSFAALGLRSPSAFRNSRLRLRWRILCLRSRLNLDLSPLRSDKILSSHFISLDPGNWIELLWLFSWMWSHTNLSANQIAWRAARAWSGHDERCAIANCAPHWWQATVVMTTVPGRALSVFWRNRLAVPCGPGCSTAGNLTIAVLAADERDHGRIRRPAGRAPPSASPR